MLAKGTGFQHIYHVSHNKYLARNMRTEQGCWSWGEILEWQIQYELRWALDGLHKWCVWWRVGWNVLRPEHVLRTGRQLANTCSLLHVCVWFRCVWLWILRFCGVRRTDWLYCTVLLWLKVDFFFKLSHHMPSNWRPNYQNVAGWCFIRCNISTSKVKEDVHFRNCVFLLLSWSTVPLCTI